MQRLYKIFEDLNDEVFEKFKETLPGFDRIARKVAEDFVTRMERLMQKKEEEKKKRLSN